MAQRRYPTAVKKHLPKRPVARPTNNGVPLEGCYGGFSVTDSENRHKIIWGRPAFAMGVDWAVRGSRGASCIPYDAHELPFIIVEVECFQPQRRAKLVVALR